MITWKDEHVDILVAFLSNYFHFPSHPHLRTHRHPPSQPPLLSSVFCTIRTPSMIQFFWGGVDSSYPKNTEIFTKEHVIDSKKDPSVEMRSLDAVQSVPRTASESCAERPNRHRGNRREKERCASFCIRASFAQL